MTAQHFVSPDVESMSHILPAFDFVTKLAADEDKAVYVAKQRSLDRQVALKVYSPEISGQSSFRDSFGMMARQMARLNHLNLIGIYDSGVAGGMLYLVMEFVAGKPLWNSTRGKPVQAAHLRSLMSGIADGMSHAHEHGICHGGLSLSSVLLGQDRQPKIGGFSHAVSVGHAVDGVQDRFRAPELAPAGALPTVAADIYSLGAITRELLMGQVDDQQGLPPKIQSASVSRVLKVCDRASAADPSQRYASAEQFKQALLDALDGKTPVQGLQLRTAARGSGPALAGRGAVAPRVARPMLQTQSGVNWKLWRNLLVIALLLLAIRFAWGVYHHQKQLREDARDGEGAVPEEQAMEMQPIDG